MSGRYLSAGRLDELAAAVTERDQAVLRIVASLRFVSGGQLTRLCFADHNEPVAAARAARRSLLRLTRLGVLDRLPRVVGGVRAGSAGFVYHLGLGGQALAIRAGLLPERRRRRSLAPGTLFVRHSLDVAELHVRITEGDRSGRFELLELTAEPSCWRRYGELGSQRARLQPDSYVRLGVGAYECSAFIEVDRGTEGSRALADQLGRYLSYHRSGIEQRRHGVFPQVLWLAPTNRRVGVIADCVSRLPSDDQALFAVTLFDSAVDFMVTNNE